MKFIAAFGLLLSLSISPTMAADKGAQSCAPEGGLKFVCGTPAAEDLVVLPGGRWMVTSGLTTKSGLYLVNLKTKTAERWVPMLTGAAQTPYQACTSPPVLDEIQAHGLSVRDRGQGRATLYVVNHGGPKPHDFVEYPPREAIEIFDADLNGAKPTLTWIGCVRPAFGLAVNSVVSTADGTIYHTVVLHAGMTMADYDAGRPTGAVYRWQPGDAGFTRVWGTELTGNNGIEISADGKTLYVVAANALYALSNTNPAKVLKRVPLGGEGDNVHWADGKLIVGGRRTPEPACADLIKAAKGELGEKCFPGYFAAAVDPATLQATTLAIGAGTKNFTVGTAAITTGKTLWIASILADRIAYLTLP